ncbi:MAG: hypothetical protein V4489_05005 [Chlamydiota bacterium]
MSTNPIRRPSRPNLTIAIPPPGENSHLPTESRIGHFFFRNLGNIDYLRISTELRAVTTVNVPFSDFLQNRINTILTTSPRHTLFSPPTLDDFLPPYQRSSRESLRPPPKSNSPISRRTESHPQE